jgi:hypothetical protein
MATHPPFDLDTVATASAASDVAPSDLATTIIQAVTVASHKRVAVVEVAS